MVGNEDKGLGFELSACWVCLAFFFFLGGGGAGSKPTHLMLLVVI